MSDQRPREWELQIPVRVKVTLMSSIITLSILQIVFAGLSYPIVLRHMVARFNGAWTKGWVGDNVVGLAILVASSSLLGFGGNSLCELYLKRPYYNIYVIGVIAPTCGLVWPGVFGLLVSYACHFMPYGRQGDGDAYWLAVWSACGAALAAMNWIASWTFWRYLFKAMGAQRPLVLREPGQPRADFVAGSNGTAYPLRRLGRWNMVDGGRDDEVDQLIREI